jgi:hypothetical protein
MRTTVVQDPLLLVLLGFSLAMSVVVVVLMLKRTSHYPPPGYAPRPVIYASEVPGDDLSIGCVVPLLLIAGFVVLLALLS